MGLGLVRKARRVDVGLHLEGDIIQFPDCWTKAYVINIAARLARPSVGFRLPHPDREYLVSAAVCHHKPSCAPVSGLPGMDRRYQSLPIPADCLVHLTRLELSIVHSGAGGSGFS